MKKSSRILSFVLVMCLLLTLIPAVYAEENNGDIVIFYTDDVHTYVNGSLGYDKAADLKSEAAKTAAGVLLVDAGDHIQGTDYGSADQGENVMKLMKAAGYDLATLGNHEFDYGMERALAITDEGTYGIPYVSCNFYHVQDGVRGDNVLDSYKVFTFGDKKVALIGITTPESQSKAPATFQDASGKDIYGVSGYANTEDLYADVQKAIDAASSEADYVIALGHLGDMESSGDWVSASLIANTSGLDAFIDGHSHNSYECLTVKDKDNNDVVLTQAGAYFNAIGKLTIAADGTITTELIKEHEGSNAEVKEFQEETWNAYMGQTLATATGDFPSTNLGTAPSAFVDLLNAVQIWGGYDRTGDNTPDDPSDDKPAMLSISAPLNSGSEGNIISKGEIKLGDIYNLYRFENWFYQIRMTGEEIHQWLEFAASKIETDENGDPFITAKNLTYYDIVYGEGFTYVIDYTREAGNRVVSMTYNGAEVTTTQEFTVMLNNFRYKDGGGYLTYLTEHGCPFTANDPDRIVYSTQYDMIEGQNLGTARALLMAYIREQELLSPVITSTWKLVANYDADEPMLKTELVADSNNMFKYGHLDLNVSTEEFLKSFSYGDIVTVTFNGKSYDFPVCSNYDDVDSFAYLIRAASGKKVVTMAINYGKLGVEAGIIEAAPEGSDVKYQLCEGVTFPIEATVTMKEAGGYAEELSIRQLNRTNNREEYPELTDEQFANFRMVTTTGIGTGVLYRSSSPINPDLGRNTYADKAAAAAGVKTFINLADTEAEATSYEGYAESYYSAQNHIFLGLPVAFTSDEFKSGLAEGFRYMATHEGPYLVHCTEGKDRAGLTSAILECFMGATAEEIAEDYVTTFRNYYNVVDGVQAPITEAQEAYLRNAILKNLALIFDVEDITTANIQLEAESYLREIGLTEEEVEALRFNLRGIRYTDVDEDAWYFDYVRELTNEGLIEGYEDGTFQPEGNLTRAEAVTLLYRLAGSPAVEGKSSFTDLDRDWYQDAIAWAEENNVINGVGNGKFEPEESVSREQFVTMLWRLEAKPEAEEKLTGFEDIEKVNDWALEAFQWAVSEGIINGTTFSGKTGTYLAPQDAITRAETAKILVVFLATVKTPA